MRYGGPRAIKEGQSGLNRSYCVAKSNNEPDLSAPHQTKNTAVYSATAAGLFLIDVAQNVSRIIITLSNWYALPVTFAQSLL